MKPQVFIASSSENLDLAYAVQEGLDRDAECTVWTQGIFTLSRPALASLQDALAENDFGVFVFSPDDISVIRDEAKRVVRDNVIFELGLFAGRLGPERCFVFTPLGVSDLHLPSDLIGITPAEYEPERQDGNLIASLGPACNRVRRTIAAMGKFQPARTLEDAVPALTVDENDCISIIQSWLGARSPSDNARAMRFDDVDRELRLAPGSARKFLAKAAQRWDYAIEREGKDTILFRSARY
ncbi:MAG: nucleotide-binding protein [Vitreimonas sp.]